MRGRRRRSLALPFLLSLLLALQPLAPAASAGSVRALAVDDDIPGVPMTSPVCTGTLDVYVDPADVYAVALARGDTVSFVVTGTPTGSRFDVALYAPGTTRLTGTVPVASSSGGTLPTTLTYRVPSGAAGTYFLALTTGSGSGEYRVSRTVTPRAPDDDIPGVQAPVSPIAGTLAAGTDDDDVYRLALAAGDKLTANLSAPAGTDFDLYLYSSEATTVFGGLPVAYSDGTSYPEVISYEPAPSRAGTYYLRVVAVSGTGAYTLAYSKTPQEADDNAPGVSLDTSMVSGGVDPASDVHDVHAIRLPSGAALSVTATLASGDANVLLFAPGTADVHSASPVAAAARSGNTRTISFRAPSPGGTYLLVVRAVSAASYSLEWSLRLATPTSFVMVSRSSNTGYATSVRIAARLTASGRALGLRAARVEQSADGRTFRPLGLAVTDASGTVTYLVRPAVKTYYRFVYAGDEEFTSSASGAAYVRPAASVSRPVAPASVRRGAKFTAYGYLKPRHTAGAYSVVLRLYQKRGTRWVLVRSVSARNVNYSTYTKYSTVVALPYSGVWRVVAVHSDAGHAPSTSAARQVTAK